MEGRASGLRAAQDAHNRFVRWAAKEVWDDLFRQLAEAGGPPSTLMLDATYVKVQRAAAGGKGG